MKTDIGGKEVIFDSYILDGFNFIKLRDIAKALNFGVTWDDAQNRITLDTLKDYTG